VAQVLVIDDSRLAGLVVDRILSAKNITTAHVRTAAEVFGMKGKPSFLRENQPEVILLDIMMPDMDGLDILRKLKSMTKEKNIPVIMISASSSEANVLESVNRGAVGFLSKPIAADKLLAELAKVASISGVTDMVHKLAEFIDPSRKAESQHGELIVGPANLNYLLEILDGDKEMMYELVQVFIEDMPGQVEDMRMSLEDHDSQLFRRSAHTFKGSVGNMGANLLTQKAAELEELGAAGDLEKAQPIFNQLKRDSEELYGALTSWLNGT